jgi:hypothetical protein
MNPRRWAVPAAAAAVSLVLAGGSPADARAGGGGCCRRLAAAQDAGGSAPQSRAPGRRLYDASTVTTLSGTVTAVEVAPGRGGRGGGLHVTVESGGRSVNVHVGPTWFLDDEGFKVAKGDTLEVTGSLVDTNGAKALIAREVKVGGKSLKLRDEQGIPVWSRGPKPR